MAEQKIELVGSEATEQAAAQDPTAGLPKIVVVFDPTAGVVKLDFDAKQFRQWGFVVAVLDQAKEFAKGLMETQQMAAMQNMAQEQAQAARLQARLNHEQNQRQQRR